MANYAVLKAAINAVIKTNGNKEITGQVLNQTLMAIVDSLGENYQFAGVAVPSTNPGTPDQNIFYLATQAGTYTNFGAIVLPAGISMLEWKNNTWSSETFFTIDDAPTAGSSNLVKSGGVKTAIDNVAFSTNEKVKDVGIDSTPTSGSDNLIKSGAVFDAFKNDGGAYDVSVHFPTGGVEGGNTYTLDGAIAMVPQNMKKGGMSIKFVSSSDNKYLQYRLMSDTFSTTESDWQGVDDAPTSESENLVKSGGVKSAVDNVSFSTSQKIKKTAIGTAIDFVHSDATKRAKVPTVGAILDSQEMTSKDSLDDFSIQDEDGNSIVLFKDGHIKTKNFNSSNLTVVDNLISNSSTSPLSAKQGKVLNEKIIELPSTSDIENIDLSFVDENGNQIAQFLNGHIKTKHFYSGDSKEHIIPFVDSNNPYGAVHTKYFVDAAKRTKPNILPLIIIAGQSNADGRVPYTDAPDWLVNNNYSIPNYFMWKDNGFSQYNIRSNNGAAKDYGTDGSGDDKFSFDPFFARAFIEYYGVPLYAIRQTMGDIGIEEQPTTGNRNYTWQPNIKSIVSGCNSMCVKLIEKVILAKQWSINNNVTLLPVAILFHQGENDAYNDHVSIYKENLSNLITFLRGIFCAPTLPFLNGYLRNVAPYSSINTIFDEMANEDYFMKVVDMDSHNTFLDDGVGLHFDSSSIAYMGEQMFENYKSLNF